jgi:hypothetical protein
LATFAVEARGTGDTHDAVGVGLVTGVVVGSVTGVVVGSVGVVVGSVGVVDGSGLTTGSGFTGLTSLPLDESSPQAVRPSTAPKAKGATIGAKSFLKCIIASILKIPKEIYILNSNIKVI